METPDPTNTTAAPAPPPHVLIPDKTSRRKIRSFMAGQLDGSNTTTSVTTSSMNLQDSEREEAEGGDGGSSSSAQQQQQQQQQRSSRGSSDRTPSSLGMSSAKDRSSYNSRSPCRRSGGTTATKTVERTNSGGSARLSVNFRESIVQIHSSNSIKGVNASDFTIDKLRFSSLGRLYGRDTEVAQLKSIIFKKALKKKTSSSDSVLKQQSKTNNNKLSGEPTKGSTTSSLTNLQSDDISTATSTSNATTATKKSVGFQDDNSPQPYNNHKQLIMISGAAGSGKSVLALEAMPLIREQRGFYLTGKFDQTEPQKPFAAVATALQSLCEDLVLHQRAQEDGGTTSDTCTSTTGYHRWTFQFSHFVEKFHQTFETEDIQLLNTIIPSLRKVVEVEYYTSESSEFFTKDLLSSRSLGVENADDNELEPMYAFGSKATTEDYAEHKVRIQSAFKRFVKLVCGFGPLVLVLDDVQWIDLASMELLESLIQDKDTPPMTIIASYRDDGIDELRVWQRTINTLEADARALNFRIHRIHVDNLGVEDICTLLEDLISMSPEETRPLAECIHVKTGGNALYVKEFLLSLHRDELLTFEFRLMRWEWNVDEIKVNAKSTDNIVALLNRKMEELPALFSRLLPRVACLGCRFSYPMFDVVAEDCISDQEAEEALKYLNSIIRGGSSNNNTSSNNMDNSGGTKTTEGCSDSADSGTEEEPTEENPTEELKPVAVEVFAPVEDEPKLEKDSGGKRVSIKDPTEDGGASHISQTKAEILLAVCEETGFLTACGQGWFQWEHDKVQEAALLFVSNEEFPSFQFEVGKLLLQDLPEDNLAEVLFVVTSLLNSFTDSLDDKDELKIQIADLNYRSSVAAFQSSAFESAADFSQKGIALLPTNKFASHYSLATDLHELAAESLFSSGDYEKSKEHANTVIQLDTELLDKRRVYKAYILCLAGQGLVTEAKDLTVEVLQMLGVKFPKRMRQMHILGGVMQLTGTVKKTTKKIDKLKTLTDPRKVWAIDLLDRLVTYSFQAGDPDLLSLTMMKGTNLIAKWGISDKSGPLLASAGLLLVIVGNYAGAKKYAELALKYANRATEARIRLIAYRHVLHYQISITVCKKAQMQGYYAGMKTGDLESAFWCCLGFCDDQLMSGVKLSIVVKDFAMYSKQVSQYHHVMTDRCFKLGWQCAVNLVEGTSGRDILTGDIVNEEEMIAEIESDKSDGQTMYNVMRLKILGCFWFKEFDEVVRICEEWGFHQGALEKVVPGLGMTAGVYFHSALACLSVARTKKENKKGKHMKMATFFKSRIKEWSVKGNPNTQHYLSLIEAEFLTFKADNGEAKRLFESSIHTSGRLGMTHDQALAHERLAEHCMRLGYQNDAKYHFDRALELLKDWGAYARADLLSRGLLSVAPAREVVSKQVSGDMSTLSIGGISGLTGQTHDYSYNGTG